MVRKANIIQKQELGGELWIFYSHYDFHFIVNTLVSYFILCRRKGFFQREVDRNGFYLCASF